MTSRLTIPNCWSAARWGRATEKPLYGRCPCPQVLPAGWATSWAVLAVGRRMGDRWCLLRGQTCTWRTPMGLLHTLLRRPPVTPLPPTFLPTEAGFAFRYRTRRTRTPYGRSAPTD